MEKLNYKAGRQIGKYRLGEYYPVADTFSSACKGWQKYKVLNAETEQHLFLYLLSRITMRSHLLNKISENNGMLNRGFKTLLKSDTRFSLNLRRGRSRLRGEWQPTKLGKWFRQPHISAQAFQEQYWELRNEIYRVSAALCTKPTFKDNCLTNTEAMERRWKLIHM